MSQIIRLLTEAQEARIPEFQQKWQQIYRSTVPIDRERAAAALRQVYRVMGKPEPEIIFCSSPRAAIDRLQPYIPTAAANPVAPPPTDGFQMFQSIVGSIWETIQIAQKQQQSATKTITDLATQISKIPADLLGQQIERSLPQNLSPQDIYRQVCVGAVPLVDFMQKSKDYWQELESTKQPDPDWNIEESLSTIEDPAAAPQLALLSVGSFFWRGWLKGMLQATLISTIVGIKYPELKSTLLVDTDRQTQKYLLENPPIFTPELALSCTWLDFANTVLNYHLPSEKWQALQALVEQCGCIFTAGNFAIVCDRPTKMLVDKWNVLHAEGETALEYTDGFRIYAHRGQIIADRYGSVPPQLWQSEWVLTEKNPMTLRILLREIGAVRLCHELPVTELEREAEYKLLKLDNIDVRDAHILQRLDDRTGILDAAFVGNRTTLKMAIEYAHKSISSDRFPLLSNI